MTKKTNEPGQNHFWKLFKLAWGLGYMIAVPLILLGLGGRFLDRYLQTFPLFFLAGILISIIVSSIFVYKKYLESFFREY